ncbi:T9SS type A sorting domain-containing protein [candidate division KSB1 bacterium]|nr:T9SS type A sorting domain-containing protein [candidate division KSB1 bacterium]
MKRLLLLMLLLNALSLANASVPRTLFVENSTGRTLSRLDLESGKLDNDILELGLYPNQIVIWQNTLYVLCSGSAEILVIDPGTATVTDRIALPLGSNPYEMAFVGASRCYVTLSLANTVAVVDVAEKTVLGQIPVGIAPQGILVDDQTAFVTNTGLRGWNDYTQSSVSLIDIAGDSVVVTINVPTNPQAVVAAPDYRYYVLCTGDYSQTFGQLAAVSLYDSFWNYNPAVVDTFVVGGMPGAMVCLPSGSIFMADWGDQHSGFLYKFDVYSGEFQHKAGNPVRVAKGATRLLYDDKTDDLYVSGFVDGVVQRIDPQSGAIEQTYGFGDGAQDLAILDAIPETDPWADNLVVFEPGENWSGFGSSYFPYNVLGPPTPDPSISAYNPAYKASDILSLGYGGEIVLRFENNIVINGPGTDLLVFENCFISYFSPQAVVEPGIVSVSQDGENWVTFPYDTTTLEGLAGVTPVRSTMHPTDPDSSGADAFDLADVGFEWIRYVRITDVGDKWRPHFTSRDFDLDAVVAINSAKEIPTAVQSAGSRPHAFTLLQNYPNPFNPQTTIAFEARQSGRLSVDIYNIAGQRLVRLYDGVVHPGAVSIAWNAFDEAMRPVGSGIYFARVTLNRESHILKMTLMR